MNPRHYLAHVLLQHHPARRDNTAIAAVLKEHFAKTLSADALTGALRERLGRKRQRASVQEELSRLEREIDIIGEIKDERIESLRTKIQELQKKIIRAKSTNL